jgi:xanthine dehydrogenase accessory factor
MAGEFVEVSEEALAALQRGESVALATVVRVRGSAPRHAGARMLVWPDGRIVGTVGGATLEQRVIEHAQEALRKRRSRYETYALTPQGDMESLGLCGGEVEVHIEVLEPTATLYVIGAGHVALPLAEMAHHLGMRVVIVDDRPEFATQERFPHADRVGVVNYDPEREELGQLPIPLDPSCHVVVATWGWDEPALAQVLAADPPPAYVGLVASRTKVRVIRHRLEEQGFAPETLDRIWAPIGLDLGAETPGEIALSILAEILLQARGGNAQPLSRKDVQPGNAEKAE